MTLGERIKTLADKIKDAKISALRSVVIVRYEYLTEKESRPTNVEGMLSKKKFEYSPADKVFGIQKGRKKNVGKD